MANILQFVGGVSIQTIVASVVIPLFSAASGSDTASGDEQHPFRTIQHAQLAVRNLKASHGGHVPPPGVQVHVAAGSYDFSDAPLEFSAEDSGDADAPVVYVIVCVCVLCSLSSA